MEDVSVKLLEEIQGEFKRLFDESGKISDLYKRVRDGTAATKDAQEFASEVGNILAKVFKDKLSSDVLPDGKMYYNIAKSVLEPTLTNNYELVSAVAMDVQSIMNRSAGIGLKSVKPELNEDKVQGIIDIVSGKETYDDIAYMLYEPVVNFTQCVVDDTVRANADFQYKAGLSPKIVRTSSGKCCEWCEKLVGTYDYEDVKDTGNDVFRRHRGCLCLVEFIPAKGSARQNVHSKNWADETDVQKRIENSIVKSQPLTKRTREQAEALNKKLSDQMRTQSKDISKTISDYDARKRAEKLKRQRAIESREEWINRLVNERGMTRKQASIYYNKNKIWLES